MRLYIGKGFCLRGRSIHDVETVRRNAGDSHVGLDPTPLVQHLGIDHLPWHDVNLVPAQAIQHAQRIPSLEEKLAEGGLVEQTDILTHSSVLSRRMGKPILFAVRILIPGFHTRRSKPVCPLPSSDFSETRPLAHQPVVQRRQAYVAAGCILPERPVHIV